MTDASDLDSSPVQSHEPVDISMIEDLLARAYARLKESEAEPKIADFLKLFEFKCKLHIPQNGKRKLLEMVDSVRQEELQRKEEDDAPHESSE